MSVRRKRWSHLDAPELPGVLPVTVETPPPTELSTAVTPRLAAVDPPTPLAFAELLAFPVRLVSRLPAPTTLMCSQHRLGAVAFTTSRAAWTTYRERSIPVFSGIELNAAALAAEHDRGSELALAEWLERKAADRAWTLSAAEAIGEAFGKFEPRGWCLGHVLRRYGLELCGVGVDSEVPEPRSL
jgi:hypothetical protein